MIVGKGKVLICPRCGSTDVELESDELSGTGKPNPYVCNNCGFMSFIFPEINTKEAKKIKVKIKEFAKMPKPLDTSSGKFLASGTKLWWKIMGPISLILSLIFLYASVNVLNIYASISLVSLSAVITFFAYILPDEMTSKQSRVWGWIMLILFIINFVFILI